MAVVAARAAEGAPTAPVRRCAGCLRGSSDGLVLQPAHRLQTLLDLIKPDVLQGDERVAIPLARWLCAWCSGRCSTVLRVLHSLFVTARTRAALKKQKQNTIEHNTRHKPDLRARSIRRGVAAAKSIALSFSPMQHEHIPNHDEDAVISAVSANLAESNSAKVVNVNANVNVSGGILKLSKAGVAIGDSNGQARAVSLANGDVLQLVWPQQYMVAYNAPMPAPATLPAQHQHQQHQPLSNGPASVSAPAQLIIITDATTAQAQATLTTTTEAAATLSSNSVDRSQSIRVSGDGDSYSSKAKAMAPPAPLIANIHSCPGVAGADDCTFCRRSRSRSDTDTTETAPQNGSIYDTAGVKNVITESKMTKTGARVTSANISKAQTIGTKGNATAACRHRHRHRHPAKRSCPISPPALRKTTPRRHPGGGLPRAVTGGPRGATRMDSAAVSRVVCGQVTTPATPSESDDDVTIFETVTPVIDVDSEPEPPDPPCGPPDPPSDPPSGPPDPSWLQRHAQVAAIDANFQPKNVDWETKIPMDLISFVDASDKAVLHV